MTEKEKAAKGLLYDANYDKQLLEERKICKEICYKYNQLSPLEEEKRDKIIRSLFGRTGKRICVEQPFYCDYGYNIEVGENFFCNVGCVILDGAHVRFGNNVFIAPYCGFYTAGHPIDAESREKGLEYAYPITIGDNVWIGAHSCILPGVTIGNNTVIGAGSIVTRDIPANVIAVGNPCRIIKHIQQDE